MRLLNKVKMGISILSTAALLCPLSSYAAENSTSSEQPTPPGVTSQPSGAYQTGVYPNLFAKAGYSQSQINDKLNTIWNQFFHGEQGFNGQSVYYQVPGHSDMAYIEAIGGGTADQYPSTVDVRTEGMGYAMMIALQLNHKQEFDALWNYAKTYMQFKDGPAKNFFVWHTQADGTTFPNDTGVAPDGDQWITAALLFASERWGNGTGIYDYRQEANTILHAMWNESTEVPNGVDMFDRNTYLPTFSPPYAVDFTDPSYCLPAFYKIFAMADPSDRNLWNKAYTASEELLQKAYNSGTGLAPDYSNFDGTPHPWQYSPGYGENFESDAFRAIANANVDAAWFGVKPWQTTYSDTLENFLTKQGINTYASGYSLDGTPLQSALYHSQGLVAMNSTSAISATNSNSLDFVKAFWNTGFPSGQWRYYDGMLYTLGFLYDSGNFKIWWPPYDHRQAPEGNNQNQ